MPWSPAGRAYGYAASPLWLLGGVAQLEDEPASPCDDLRVAIVGPAVSLALAVGFGLAAVVLGVLATPTLAGAVAGWLAVSNLALAVFNLLPAAPLDGGRVLRAVVDRLLNAPTTMMTGGPPPNSSKAISVPSADVAVFIKAPCPLHRHRCAWVQLN